MCRCYLGHVYGLRVKVQHAGLQNSLHDNLRKYLGLLNSVQDCIVLVLNAQVIAAGSPEHQEVLKFSLSCVFASIVIWVEKVLAKEGPLHHRHVNLTYFVHLYGFIIKIRQSKT